MNIKPLKKLQNWKSPKELYDHCLKVIIEKENYAKIRVKKAQQCIDEYLTTGTIEL